MKIEEKWLFDPQNKELVQELQKALKQKADININLDDFEVEKEPDIPLFY